MISHQTKQQIDNIVIESKKLNLNEERFLYKNKFYSLGKILRRAQSQDLTGIVILASILCTGVVVQQDLRTGMGFLKELAPKFPLAKLELCWRHNKSGNFIDQYSLIEELVAESYLPAICRMAALQKNGVGTKKDIQKYESYLNEAAKRGHIQAKKEISLNHINSNKIVRQYWGKLTYFTNVVSGIIYMLLNPCHEKLIS